MDVLSGTIKPVTWKEGTTDTLDLVPVKDSIIAITDENYFDWPVLPEAPVLSERLKWTMALS